MNKNNKTIISIVSIIVALVICFFGYNLYQKKQGSTYTILKNFLKVESEDRDKVYSTKTFNYRSFKRFVTRKEVLAIDSLL